MNKFFACMVFVGCAMNLSMFADPVDESAPRAASVDARRLERERCQKMGLINHLVSNAEQRGHEVKQIRFIQAPTYAEVVRGFTLDNAIEDNFTCPSCNQLVFAGSICDH